MEVGQSESSLHRTSGYVIFHHKPDYGTFSTEWGIPWGTLRCAVRLYPVNTYATHCVVRMLFDEGIAVSLEISADSP